MKNRMLVCQSFLVLVAVTNFAVTSCGLTDSCWSELTGFSGLGQGVAVTKFFCGHLVERNAAWLLKAARVLGLWPFPSPVTVVASKPLPH